MMAFFDSLIQREIEGWDSDSDDSLSSDSDSNFCKEVNYSVYVFIDLF